MTTALSTASPAYGPDRPSAVATVDNTTTQGSTYHRGNSVQTNGAGSLQRRYMTLETLAEVGDNPVVSLSAVTV